MPLKIHLAEITADVIRKPIRNIYLRVCPLTGAVRISAPERMSIDAIHKFAWPRLDWVRKQQSKIREQVDENPYEYCGGEIHKLWGKPYYLKVIEKEDTPVVYLMASEIALQVRSGADQAQRGAVLDAWYRTQLEQVAAPLIKKWEQQLSVSVARVTVRKMKTRWGSCTPLTRAIRINFDLVKKPQRFLEYIVVHELLHLIEPSHNQRFIALIDQNLPQWRYDRDALNFSSQR